MKYFYKMASHMSNICYYIEYNAIKFEINTKKLKLTPFENLKT